MEIEATPVTLEQRIECLNQAAANAPVNKKSFPWGYVIVSGLIGAGICLTFIYYNSKRKNKEK